MRLTGAPVTLPAFCAALDGRGLQVSAEVRDRIAAAHVQVLALAAGDAPIYGLNTALGANLNHRIAADEQAAFQHQLIAARATGAGPPLSEPAGRATLLARIVSAASVSVIEMKVVPAKL